MANISELVAAAERFERAQRLQQRSKTKEGERAMAQARMRFGPSRVLDPRDSSAFFEAVLEGSDLMPVSYLEMGRLAARAVGRLTVDLGPLGACYGTGFLVAPGLLLTNQHVLREDGWARAATVDFGAETDVKGLPGRPRVFRLDPASIYVADEKLDFCFVGVESPGIDGDALAELGHLRLQAAVGKILRDEYATIIQHPRGRNKQIALRNNRIEVYVYDAELDERERPDNNFLYYGTDTQRGSSGAPVFSDQWYVIALHRRGVPKLKMFDGQAAPMRLDRSRARPDDPEEVIAFRANEGVRISRIVHRLRSIATGRSAQASMAEQAAALLEATGRSGSGPVRTPPRQRSPAPLPTTAVPAADVGLEVRVVRRNTEDFADAPGYDKDFLRGHSLALPTPGRRLKARLARHIDDGDAYLLHFVHFTTVVDRTRRLPVYAAVNIDGSAADVGGKVRRPPWAYDPRIAKDEQLHHTLLTDMLQTGHLAARDIVYWGDVGEQADLHSFTLSNACPQMDSFNSRGGEWFQLERAIMKFARDRRLRLTCFMGPVLQANDPLYDDLRSPDSRAAHGTGIRIPQRFWYIVAWVDGDARTPRHLCLALDQSDEIQAAVDAGGLEAELALPARVVPVSLASIEDQTGLRFDDLH